jgi:hypothetical protein
LKTARSNLKLNSTSWLARSKKLEGARDEVANAAAPIVQAMFFNNNGPSALDASEIFDKLRVAPDTYFKNIK